MIRFVSLLVAFILAEWPLQVSSPLALWDCTLTLTSELSIWIRKINVPNIREIHQIFTSNIHKYLSNIHLSWGYASLFASSNFRMHWSNILKRLSARDLVVTMVVRTSLFRRCAETQSFLIRGVIQCSFRSSRLRSALLKL